jgi:methylated-DNA-[protein]-cysteine S-methyltransferase
MNKVRGQLEQYFSGERKTFQLTIKMHLPRFYEKSLNEVKKIPYADTYSYSDIAKKIEAPNSYRAVANANANNPIPIVIPCHRVIKSSGMIGGYAGGYLLKKQLLKLESN